MPSTFLKCYLNLQLAVVYQSNNFLFKDKSHFRTMLYLLKRYKEDDIKDEHCQQFCNKWLSVVGILPHKRLTIHSTFTFFILVFTLGVWTYTYIETKTGDSTEALHRICLSLCAIGLFSVQFFKHEEFKSVAKQIDDCFSFSSSELKLFFRKRQMKLLNSKMKIYTDFFSILVFIIYTNVLINMYLESFSLNDIKPPPPMILPIESKALYFFIFISETAFIVIASIVDIMVAQFFMICTIQLKANLEVVCSSLKYTAKFSKNEFKIVPDSEISASVAGTIKHHQEIFRSFNSLKRLFDKIFFILYFSIMSAIAMCRTLLVGDVNVLQLLPIFYLDTGCLHIFCYFADLLAEESSNVRLAAYSTPWFNFSKNICTSLRIIVTRALEPPKFYFFVGGSEVSCATYTVIVNASMTYFFISFMTGNQN